ncbi:MAG TPA: efflux RND transporter periplasmic adaptor subunit [Saprospiraceae bacterium]|nr:efflux RND transporter periplasmic adaptor subunit [Saprospiraceae bacterium]HMP24494.1 efflux RND transporter periplasmic adaptor subunit [Saprospiraceae bacterium]
MNNTSKYVLAVAVALAVGLLLGKWFFSGSDAHEHAHEEIGNGNTIWTCSMDPQVRQNKPGSCPICGMDLIPLDDNQDADLDPDAIRLSASAMHLAQVATAEVQQGQIVKTTRLNGKVAADERQIFTQSAHLPGRIERLMVNFTGEAVRKGQVIAQIYSPELVTAQEELFQALKIKATVPALYEAAREKLRYWKLSDEQINAIEAAGKPRETFDIKADVSGIVVEKKVNSGDYVARGGALFTIANLDKVWVLLEAYESDLHWVKKGSPVEFTVASLPGEQFRGTVSFVDPVVNAMSRTASLRVEMPNLGGKLKPEMFVVAEIKSAANARGDQLMVPRSAVLWTGKRSIVYVQDMEATEPTFLLREVTLGPALGDSYAIENGLRSGEVIVINGTFAIDAAAQLAGKKSMMRAKGSLAERTAPIAIGKQERQHIARVVEHYLQLKDALVQSDAAVAKGYATNLAAAIGRTPANDFQSEAQEYWLAVAPLLSDLANKMIQAGELAGMRQYFTPFSDRMSNLIKVFGPLDVPVFVQFCPMANSNKGGYWLSQQQEIRNPYYGDEMLTCGKVVAEIR